MVGMMEPLQSRDVGGGDMMVITEDLPGPNMALGTNYGEVIP